MEDESSVTFADNV